MATSQELRERLDQETQMDEQKRQRMQAAIEAREHAEQYQGDSDEANQQADKAEQAIEQPQ